MRRFLLIPWVANTPTGIFFGNLIRDYDEYPSITEINRLINLENKDIDTNTITIMNVVELLEDDFYKLVKR